VAVFMCGLQFPDNLHLYSIHRRGSGAIWGERFCPSSVSLWLPGRPCWGRLCLLFRRVGSREIYSTAAATVWKQRGNHSALRGRCVSDLLDDELLIGIDDDTTGEEAVSDGTRTEQPVFGTLTKWLLRQQ